MARRQGAERENFTHSMDKSAWALAVVVMGPVYNLFVFRGLWRCCSACEKKCKLADFVLESAEQSGYDSKLPGWTAVGRKTGWFFDLRMRFWL
jgi:hypothetical protein